jgi:acetyl esterase/lipase
MTFTKAIVIGCAIWALALPTIIGAAEPAVDVQRARVYIERDSGPLAADVYTPHGRGPFPGMLVVHGGAWTMGTRAQLAGAANEFAKHGYTAVAISYRLAPQYKFPAQIFDCQAAVRWMRAQAAELRIDPVHIGGFGYSAGGHLVALLGTLDENELREKNLPANAPSARLQVVLAGGAPCDFRSLPSGNRQLAFWLGGSRSEKPQAYRDASPATYISADDPPMFFFHGAQDWLVPVASPRRMVAQLKTAGLTAEMYTVKDSGHIQTFFDRESLAHAVAFADRYLKTGGVASTGSQTSGTSHGQ